MIRLELDNGYGVTVDIYETDASNGIVEIDPSPRVFGWPQGWRVRCTVRPDTPPEIVVEEGEPE